MPDELTFREAELAGLLKGSNGGIAQEVARLAMLVESQAKLNATQRPGPRVDTGRLRSSISWRLGSDSEGVYADIGTGVPYGRILELGLTRNGARYPFLEPALDAVRNR